MEETAVQVHRCRFVDFTPSPVTALAFPPLPLPKNKTSQPSRSKFGTLAVGHANGNIDLCSWTGAQGALQSPQAWVVSKTITGLYPSKVDSLAFSIKDPQHSKDDDVPPLSALRLFSSGGGSEVIEWDIEQLCVRRTLGSQAGAIWSIAVNPASTLLALGCEDGSVRILSLAEDNLTHFRRFDRVKSRLLSIAWGPPVLKTTSESTSTAEEDYEWTDSWLATGGSDSSLRKWDVKTGRPSERMNVDKMRGERTLVWTVCVLGDGTIVSGDSLGMVKFWDSKTCTQMQSFQGHGADVLCLTISPEGSVVYSSGVDQKITQFSIVKNQTGEGASTSQPSRRWVQASSRRMHSHDVRALATWPPYSPLPPAHKRRFPADVAPILVSGGLDMSVVVTPAALPGNTVVKITNPLATSTEATFADSYHRRLAYAPGPSNAPAIRVARGSRLVSCMHDASVSIWRINTTPSEDATGQPSVAETDGWEKLLDMDLAVHTNLIASSLSDDGKWLVVSDLYESKLFSLAFNDKGELTPKRVKSFSSVISTQLALSPASSGGLAFAFTPDSSKLLMSSAISSAVLVIDLTQSEGPRILRSFDQHVSNVGERVTKPLPSDGDGDVDMDAPESSTRAQSGTLLSHVIRITVSADGQWAATTDDRARTHVFNLDSLQHHCILPSFAQPAQTLAFAPASTSLLTLIFPDNSIQIYDVETRQFPSWSKDLISNVSQRLSLTHDSVIGIAFDPAATKYALLWGSTWMCKIPMDGSSTSGGSSKKRQRRESLKRNVASTASADPQGTELKMITRYRPILFAEFIAPGELLVVERPLVDVLATLPPAYFKQKYGAS
ncbi:WD40 repeat-like protein [Hymenopellis radicata]|nr:WD40 repeat-like protein [Hymenopellis radicata]